MAYGCQLDLQCKPNRMPRGLYLSKPVRGRRDTLKEKGACWSCLKRGHRIQDCGGKKPCGVNDCNMFHRKTLHEEELDKEKTPTNIVSANGTASVCNIETETCLLQVRKIPTRNGFANVLGGGDALNVNRFPISRCQDPVICPVSNLNLYVKLCDLMNINLRDGYLFRALNDANAVSDSPFVGAAIANRLKTHLQMANIHGGETMNSFGSGCAIALSLLGVSPDDIARHVGWKSLSTMEYYSQTGKVMRSLKVAATLASSTSSGHGNQAQAFKAGAVLDANNDLTGFKPAKKCTKIYIARVQLLCYSINLLFDGGLLVVVVCISFLNVCQTTYDIWEK